MFLFRKNETFEGFFMTKENWTDRLPEIDVIPVVKEKLPSTTSRLRARKNIKKSNLVGKGYKNPFTYTNCHNRTRKNWSQPQDEIVNTIKWTCMICNDVKNDKQSLIKHYEEHKNEKEEKSDQMQGQNRLEDYFKCVVCSREFTSARSYENHLERKHGENRYYCEQCNKTYKNSFQLCLHNFTSHTNNGRYKCIICDFSTLHRTSIKTHLQKHDGDYKFECDVCDRKFFTENLFEMHKNSHVGAMPFQCEICLKNFPYSRYLVAHKKSMHSQDCSGTVPVNKCDICQKLFAHKKSLILHLRLHTGENAVLCDVCGKCLSSTEHLKQHLRIHSGYKPYTCGVCGKGFSKKSNLTLHERVHSGEKPYICLECEKCFSQRSTLVIHQRYHSGERPYTCTVCNKGFVAKGLLRIHLKSCSKLSD